ncbi:MAG TPA: thiol peroxidase [Synergistaceae bacterium]|nr:thiol peroxidase [Synergistaceae bacterium]HPJ25756.1 thiol peroxidase [Synergistaceae bacterium]HPQ37033.1 thiol peroxidase [Synergistaceae bacterium]
MEREGIITMKGNPLTLVGPELRPGDRAPDFSVLDQSLQPVSLANFSGKIKVISTTPSLDTPVCDLQAHRFNEEAASLGEHVVILNISMDLPFAIARFCIAGDIKAISVLSDHREASFGTKWGMLIKELRLLARGAFIVDQGNIIRYAEIVSEQTDQPDYDKILSALRKL